MKVAVFLILGLLSALASPAAADCVAERDPEITVAITEAPLRTDRSFSRMALAQRVGGVAAGWHALGLTEVSLETAIDYGFVIVPAGKAYCATFSKVAVTVTLNLVVNLASELRRGTCANQAVEEHEQQHVDLERRTLPLEKMRVEAAVAGAARHGASGKTIETATEALQQTMSDIIGDALQSVSDEKNRKHATFDTRAEYKKLSLRCSSDEIRALLGE